MSMIKHWGVGFVSILAFAVMGLAGCASDPESGTEDDVNNSEDNASTSEDAISVSGCTTNLFSGVTAGGSSVPNPNPALLFNYVTDKGLYSTNTGISRGYDVTDVCLAKVNALRKATNVNWPNYTKKAATTGVSKIGCGVEYEAKLAMKSSNGHASANIGWAAQGGAGAVLVKPGDPHLIWYKAADTTEATQKLITELYNEKDASGNPGGHAQALRLSTTRPVQCGMWQTWNAQYQTNDLYMVIDYWN